MIGMRWNGKDLRPFSLWNSLPFRSWSLSRWGFNMECPNLESLPEGIGALTSLQTLKILHCPKLESLPEVIGALTSLQTLNIQTCPKLESLPEGIGALTSLQTLKILHCPKLESLPEEICLGKKEEPDEEEPNEEAKKPACQNWDLIKAFGCCNYSTTQQLTHWIQLIVQDFIMYIYIACFQQQYVAFSSDSSMEHKTRSGDLKTPVKG
nr:putative disease resistance protein [Quercus suber]